MGMSTTEQSWQELALENARLRTELAVLRVLEQRFRTTLYSIGDGVIATDNCGIVMQVNAVAEALTGWSEAEAVGRPVDEVFRIVNEHSRALVESPVRRVLAEGRVVGLANHTILVSRDGKERPIADSGAPIRDGQGQIVGVVLVFRDQTAERAAQAALEEAEERFRVFFDSAPIGKAMTAPDGRLMRVNAAFGEMVGRSVEEMQVISFPSITHPDDLAMSRECVRSLLAGEHDTWTMEKRYLHRDGSVVWTHVKTRLRRDAAGVPQNFLTHVVDITPRKQAEAELQQINAALVRSNRELEQFAYVASHDLQEPLRMVASFSQLLAERYADQLDDRARKYIGYAVDGAKRMQSLINDLLAFSRLETRPRPLEPCDCSALLAQVIRGLDMAVRESGAEIVTGPLPVVKADRTQLGQVFQNLVANAIKFRGEAPIRVEVTARRAGDWWELTVADNGLGIDPRDHERIFVIFQRLNERTRFEGNGIGLAVVKKIVERHGGTIRVESALGQGARFTFTMPAE